MTTRSSTTVSLPKSSPSFAPTAWRESPRSTITSAGRPTPLKRGESWRACRRLTACGKKRRAKSGPGASRKPSPPCAFARTPSLYYLRVRAHNELALDAFTRLEQLPPSAESHHFRALLFRNQGRHQESIDELKQAQTLAPDDRDIQRELATSYYFNRDYESAERLLERLVKLMPQSAELQFLYGDTLLLAQKPEHAIPPLEAAARANPGVLPGRAALARAYLQVGRQADAIPHLKAALETDEDGSLHYQLARAYQATGQPVLAKQMMAKYQAILKAKTSESRQLPTANSQLPKAAARRDGVKGAATLLRRLPSCFEAVSFGRWELPAAACRG